MGQRIMALELAGERVRAAIAERTWNAFELIGAWEQGQRADEPDLAPAISRIVAAAGIPDVVISALPGEFVAKRLLSLPFSDRRRLAQVVPFALEEHLPFPVDDAAVAFARVGRENANTLVIAAFARRVDVRNHLDLLGRAGLDPKLVTLGTLALAGLLARARNGADTAHLVIDVDHGSTSMVLIDEGGTPRAVRTVGRGIEPGGEVLPSPAAAAIMGAVRQTLLAHQSNGKPAELILTGVAATVPAVREQLSGGLSMSVHYADEFDCSPFFDGHGSTPVTFAPCLAMLLAEAPSHPLELLNFRHGEFAFIGGSGLHGPLRLTARLAAVALAFALINFLIAVTAGVRELHRVNREIAAVAAPAIGNADPAAADAMLKQKISTMRKRLHLMGGNLGHGSPLDVLLALSQAVPPRVPMQVNDLVVDFNTLKIQGTAESFASVDQVKKALERSPLFANVSVEHASAGSDPSKIDFEIDTALREAVPGA